MKNIILAPGETVLNQWDYGKTKKGFTNSNTVEHGLILTDKRVVSISEGKRTVSRNEIPLKEAKTVSGYALHKTTIFTYIKIVIFAVLSLAIIGIPLLLNAIRELRSCAFALEITTRVPEGTSLTLGAETQQAKKGLFSSLLPQRKEKILVDKQVAFKIIDEISAAIVAAQNN